VPGPSTVHKEGTQAAKQRGAGLVGRKEDVPSHLHWDMRSLTNSLDHPAGGQSPFTQIWARTPSPSGFLELATSFRHHPRFQFRRLLLPCLLRTQPKMVRNAFMSPSPIGYRCPCGLNPLNTREVQSFVGHDTSIPSFLSKIQIHSQIIRWAT
jgi:hypothetical protein